MRLYPVRRRSGAFTMIEMMTVIGIIVILIALVTPALLDVIRSTRLNSSGDALTNRISLAQQSAISLGTEVELRFYRYVDDNSDRPDASLYRAYQVVQLPVVGSEIRPQAVSDPYYIESGIVLSNNQELSPMLQTSVNQQPLPNSGGNYLFTPANTDVQPSLVEYAALKFFPDGSCRLLTGGAAEDSAAASALAYTVEPLTESFFTFVESREAENGQPKNFYCIQIDFYTGKTRVYRP